MSTNVGQANITIKADASSARATIQQAAQQMRRDLAGLTGLKVGATVALKAPTKAEVAAALSGIKGEKTIKIKVDSADAATTIGRIKTLLSGLGSSVNGLFTINTAGLGTILSATTSMNTQFRDTLTELRAVLTEIRRTRPPTGPPGGGSGGTGGAGAANALSAQLRLMQADLRAGITTTAQYEAQVRSLKTAMDAEAASLRGLGVLTREQQARLDALRVASAQAADALKSVAGTSGTQQLTRDLQTAQSQYERGATSLRTYLRELERIRAAAGTLAPSLAAGSAEARQLERVMTGLSTAGKKINDQSIVKLRADLAGARAEFERATVAAGRFGEKRAAVRAYEDQIRSLETRLRSLSERSTLTAGQLGQVNRLTAQLASQRGALDGTFTNLGLSGGVLNALKMLPQFAAQAGGSLGAAALQADAFAGGLGSIGAAAGPMAVALTAGAAALLAVGAAAVSALNAYLPLQDAIQNAKGTLGLFGAEGRAAGKELQALAQDPALAKLGFNSVQAAHAIEELGSRGLDTAEILNGGLNTTAKLAAASGVKDLNVAAEVLVGTMKAFGIQGREAAAVPDLLANAANVSALKLTDFQLAIAAGGSAARTSGVDLTAFTATMSLMRDRLISASDAGTSFKSFTQALTPNSKDAAAAMAKLGFNAFDATGKMKPLRQIIAELERGMAGYTDQQRLATLELIFGSDGVRTATTLLDAYNTKNGQGVRLLDERTAALQRQGTADLAARERTSSLTAAQAELASKIQTLKQRIGEALAPALESLIGIFGRFIDKGLTPAVEGLEKFLNLINGTKTPQEIQATLKITASDDFTTGVLKLLGGGVVGLQQMLGGMNASGQAQWDGWMGALSESQQRARAAALRRDLINNNLLKPLEGPDGAYKQVSMILADYDRYLKIWQDSVAKSAGAIKDSLVMDGVIKAGQTYGAVAGKPTPLAGQGPLLPGQTRAAPAALQILSLDDKSKAFFRAIFGQESGGDYNAFNTDYRKGGGQGALGKYQVMPQNLLGMGWDVPQSQRGAWALANLDNMGVKGKGWDFEVLKKDITPRQFLASKEYQEAISQARMSANLQKRLMDAGGDLEMAVKEAAKDWYGRVAPAKGPTPEQYAASIWARFQQEAGGGGAMPGAAVPAKKGPASSDALKAEAERLLRAEDAAKKAGNVDRITQVQGMLKAFTDSGPRAAAALDLVRDKLGQTKKEVSQFGQGYDRLNQSLDTAENTFKLTDDTKGYIKALGAVRDGALKAAEAERRANGETEKYQALKKLAGDAASKARQQQEGLTRASEQARQEQERKEKEAQARAKDAAQQGLDLNRLVSQGRVDEAQRVLGALRRSQQEELDLAGSNVAKRLEIVQRTGPAIVAGERKIAERTRDVAVKDAKAWADAEIEKAKASLSGQALRSRLQDIETVRVGKVREAYATAKDAVTAAETAQTSAVRQGTAARSEALKGLTSQYQTTIDTFAQKLASGSVTDDDLLGYWRDLNKLLADAKAAGLDVDPVIKGLRDQSRALAQEGPGVQAWAQAFQDAQAAAQTRYGNADAVMDYSLRGSYGVGQAGYDAALKGFGVRSIEQLEQFNRPAAEAMRRVYADVLIEMERELAAAVERAQAILDYYKSEADRIADNTATQADLAVGRKNQEDGARVAGLSKAGPFGMLNFLGGASNSFFGEKYWTELGEQGRADFTDALNKFEPEDFSRLGVTFLRGIRDKIGNSPEWADLTAKLNGGIELAQAQGSSKAGFEGIGQVIAQYNQLDTRSAAYADTIRTKLIPELVRIRDASSDQSVKDMAAGAIEALTGEVDAARQLADLAVEGKLQALDTQRALGAIGERAYQAQRQQLLIEQETARYRLDIQDKTGAALELAEAQHQLRLGKIIGDGLVQSADLTKTAQGELASAQRELNQALGVSEPVYASQVRALEELKKKYPELTAEIDKLLGRYRELQQLDPLVGAFKGASQILGKNSPLQAGLSSVTDGLSAFFGAGGAKGGKEAILKGAASLVGGLVDVFKTGDEDVDRVTNTFVSGLQGTLMQLAQGNWVGALIAGVATVVSTIVDIFVGGANSAKKAREQITQATDGIKFFDLSKYAKVESRGGFLGFLGFKKSSIDQEALDIARTLGDAIYTAISGGMLDGIKAGKTSFADLGIDLKKSLAQDILQGLIDGFLQGAVMKEAIQPFLDRYIAAKKTADPNDDVAAAEGLQQAVIGANADLQQFYEQVLVPTAQQLGAFGTDTPDTSAPVGGNAAVDLGLVSGAGVTATSEAALNLSVALPPFTAALTAITPVLESIAEDGFQARTQVDLELRSTFFERVRALLD